MEKETGLLFLQKDKKTLFLAAGLLFSFFIFWKESSDRLPFTAAQIAGRPEVSRRGSGSWKPLKTGQLLTENNTLRTGPESSVELDFSEHLKARLGPDTRIHGEGPRFRDGIKTYEVTLEKGTVFAAPGRSTPVDEILEFEVLSSRIRTSNGVFRIQTDPVLKKASLSVLRGEVEVLLQTAAPSGPLTITAFQSLEWSDTALLKRPAPISFQEWQNLFEAYLLVPRELEYQQAELEAARKMGNLFDRAYFMGDFFTPKKNYVESNVIPPDEGAPRGILDIYYDLSAPGSFAGVYLQIRELHPENFSALRFRARRKAGFPFPQNTRIEFKSEQRVIQSFVFQVPVSGWADFSMPVPANLRSSVSEIVILFTHQDAGAGKQGYLQMTGFELEAKKEEK